MGTLTIRGQPNPYKNSVSHSSALPSLFWSKPYRYRLAVLFPHKTPFLLPIDFNLSMGSMGSAGTPANQRVCGSHTSTAVPYIPHGNQHRQRTPLQPCLGDRSTPGSEIACLRSCPAVSEAFRAPGLEPPCSDLPPVMGMAGHLTHADHRASMTWGGLSSHREHRAGNRASSHRQTDLKSLFWRLT
jgi:hypothetical protein